ncbi:MAG: trypsin-like peptidase domain-containing protein [Planctomycetota bacterium]
MLAGLEDSLVGLIERSERSVVSITRYTPDQLAVELGTARQGQRRVPQPQIFIQGRQRLPGALQNLQQVPTARPLASGAGVVIDEGGLILTHYQVVKLGASHVVSDVEGKRYLATIRAADPRSGLAVLAIQRSLDGEGRESDDERIELPALPIGQAEELRKGRFVVSIGNPFSISTDGQPTASWGSITNTALKAPVDLIEEKSIDGSYRTTLHQFGSLIQTDARLGWNASGGALVNLDGELVGITTTAATIVGHEQPAGYAIPLNEAMRRAVDTMRRGLEPEYGLLGINFSHGAARSRSTGETGIAVRDAFRGGPAQIAGVRSGDLLLEINGEAIRTPESLQLVVGSLAPGADVEVVFERAGKVQLATVRLGKAYIDEGQIVTRRRPSWRGLRVDYATAVPPDVLRQRSVEGHMDEQGCVVVAEVDEGSVSWESGVRPYSYISHVSGKRVTTPDEFAAAVRDAEDNVKLKFTRPLTPVNENAVN